MGLTADQQDRAAGVLLGTAVGDALGVHYEFGRPPGTDEPVEMLGGGLINGAPGEWSDDTAMTVAVARAAMFRPDLASPAGLTAVASEFLAWFASGPADIGNQTAAVLGAVASHRGAADLGERMTAAAADFARRHVRSAGNGALMRTAPVALVSLDDRDRTADAARAVAALTHADPLAGDSCVLWSEAIRVAVVDGRVDVRAGLDLLAPVRRDDWAQLLDDAEARPPSTFSPNGFTVTALQGAVAAISQTPVPDDDAAAHVAAGLAGAVRIGDDTDTVAAIAGGLLGGRWGASAVPLAWRQLVHGWPGLGADELTTVAHSLVAS